LIAQRINLFHFLLSFPEVIPAPRKKLLVFALEGPALTLTFRGDETFLLVLLSLLEDEGRLRLIVRKGTILHPE
jgi:hypothetical protein